MTSDSSAYESPPPPPPAAQAAAPAAGWTGSELAIGSALVALLIALFLPWFTVTAHVAGRAAVISGTGDGPRAHGYLWAVFALAMLGLVVLVARDFIGRVPGNLPTADQMLIGTTGLALLLTVLGVAFKPPTPGSAAIQPVLGQPVISISWSYGGFVAVVVAAIAFIAAFRMAGPLRSAERRARAARIAWRHPGADA